MKSIWIAAIAAGLLGLAAGGCSESLENVKPWERGGLAGDLLRPDLNPLEDFEWDHITFSKEGTAGGMGQGGGGCGCN